MEETNLKKDIFALFVSKDPIRPAMLSPFEVKGYAYATDGHILIKSPKEYIDFHIENKYNPPDLSGVTVDSNINELINIDMDLFKDLEIVDEYKVSEESEECETCAGNGTVMLDFENHTRKFDCPECDGEGSTEVEIKTLTGNKIFDDYLIKIKDAYFNINIFYKIIKVKEFFGEDIYLTYYKNERSIVCFKIGNIEIGIMPYIYPFLEKVIILDKSHD